MKGLGHGQVWWADIDKIRPVLLLTRAAVADQLTRVLAAPITTTVRDLPIEVPLGSGEGVAEGSVANLDNIQLVPVECLLQRAGVLPAQRWSEVCQAMAHTMACD